MRDKIYWNMIFKKSYICPILGQYDTIYSQTWHPWHSSPDAKKTFRYQLKIKCDDVTNVTANQQKVKFNDSLQKFRSAGEKHCLREYIRQNCVDDLPVPNVVHLLWYGKGANYLQIRSAIGFYRWVGIWPSGKLPFECENFAQNLILKKLPKIVIFFQKMPIAIFWKKMTIFRNFFF